MSYRYSPPTNLGSERQQHLADARKIVDAAKAADRDLTDSESTTVERHLDAVKNLDRQIEGRKTVQSVIGLGTSEDFTDDDSPRRGIFTDADAKGLVTAVKSRTAFRFEVPSKAVIGAVGLLPTSGEGVVRGTFPGAVYPLASLFANQPADGPSVRYYQMDGATAAVVAEGAVKPDSNLAITPKDAALVKLATVSTISDELAEDAPYLVQVIGEELRSSVTVAENAHIVGSWTASGILTAAATAATLIDVIAGEVGAMTATTGVVPTAVVVNPTVLASLRQLRGTSNDAYVFDPLSSAPASIHGVTLVPTASTPADTAWVVSGGAATVFRRGPITVEVGLSADDWVRNQTHLRAEERVVCAVQRPGMISKITIS